MRLFFALELSSAVADPLAAAIAPLQLLEPELVWVVREKWHLTMKFVGDAPDDAAARLGAAADRAASGQQPFEMTLDAIGAFPNFRRARVVWVGVLADPRLELLHHDLELACAAEGFEVEGRPFRPHITVARVRAPLPLERARRFAQSARNVAFTAAQDVASLTLFDSTLAPDGARHRRLHAAPLGGG